MKNILITLVVLFSLYQKSSAQNCYTTINSYSNVGDQLNLVASYDWGLPLSYTWYRDGIVVPTETDSIYTIQAVSINDMVEYKCEVKCSTWPTPVVYCFHVFVNGTNSGPLEGDYSILELIVDFDESSNPQAIRNTLTNQGFGLKESCLCEPPIELWRLENIPPGTTIVEIEETIKVAKEKVDNDGGKSSFNYFIEPEIPNYCMDEEQMQWSSLPSASPQTIDPIVIAVIDNGFDATMFPNKLWDVPSSDLQPCCSNAEPNGYNVTDECTIITPQEHGTTVTFVIDSYLPDNVNVEFMNIKAKSGRKGSIFAAVCGLRYAIDRGADIINMSMGYYGGKSDLLELAVERAEENEVLLITSSGNGGWGRNNHWPSGFALYSKSGSEGYQNILRVGSTDRLGNRMDFSSNADIYAPGYNLVCNSMDNNVVIKSGTSFSAPFVSAAAATYLIENPAATPDEIISALTSQNKWSSELYGLRVLNVNIMPVNGQVGNSDYEIISQPIVDEQIREAKIDVIAMSSIEATGEVTIRAGNSIIFIPGFHSKSGSYLHAYIDDCEGSLPMKNIQESMEYEGLRTSKDAISQKEKNDIFKGIKIIPNPFHRQANIQYELEEAGIVELSVYNVLGNKVKTLFSGYQAANQYEFIFEGGDLPTGIYYATLIKGDLVITTKMILQQL